MDIASLESITMHTMEKVTIYTDGACIGNPGCGGWAAIIRNPDNDYEISGGELWTTNNRMELQAAIEALRDLDEGCQVELFTDSEYLRQGMTSWLPGWKVKGWRKIKNKDLWLALDAEAARHRVAWHWVRGHAGDPLNSRCDYLATRMAQKLEEDSTPEKRSAALETFQKSREGQCGGMQEILLFETVGT